MLDSNGIIEAVTWPLIPNLQSARLLAAQFQFAQSEYWSTRTRNSVQSKQLALLLQHAYRTVPFYRKRFDAIGMMPADIATKDDLHKFPLLTRRDIQNAGNELHSTSVPSTHGSTSKRFTSGSTGEPVMALGTDLNDFMWCAITLRDHFWNRRDFSKKLAVIRYTGDSTGAWPNGSSATNWGRATVHVSPTGPCVTLNVHATVAQQADWLRRQRPSYLLTYPSCIEALARYFRQSDSPLDCIVELRTLGEVLDPSVRTLCSEVFGARIADIYSSQEVGYIALQCPTNETYHVQSENVIVELLDEDRAPCGDNQVGKVVVTALHSFSMPLIRYEIGDYAVKGKDCPCGRTLPVLNRIMGRQRNMVTLPSGEQLWPAIDKPEGIGFESLPPIQQMQIRQTSLQKIDAYLVTPRKLTASEHETVTKILQLGLGHPFDIEIKYVDRIERSSSGKYEDFKSELPK